MTSEIWQDRTGRPVSPLDPRAATVKYRIGDTISDQDKIRLQQEYYQPDQVGPQRPGDAS